MGWWTFFLQCNITLIPSWRNKFWNCTQRPWKAPCTEVNAVQNAPQEASSAACVSSLSSLLLVPCHVLCVQRQPDYLIDFLQQDLVCDVILDASHDLHFMQRILYPMYKRYFEKEGHQRVNLEDVKLHTRTIIFIKLNSHQAESLHISMQAFLFTSA